MLLDPDFAENGRLRLHLARANPHWKIITSQPDSPVLVVFQGPEAYVTPSWYATKHETGKVVPTWNYAIVQVSGHARVVEDATWLAQQIRDLTDAHESPRAEPWAVDDAPERYVEAQLRGIVGIEIEIAAIVGKWKVSQNRSEADRIGVAEGLAQENPAMAALVEASSARSA
jgi:transcriptional regulator